MIGGLLSISEAFERGAEAHVYVVDPDRLSDEGMAQSCLKELTEEELARHARFHFDHSKREFLAGRALMRGALAHYLGVEPSEVRFDFGREGKPELRDPGDRARGLAFNMSHTRGLVAFAIARGEMIGVDVESIEPKRADSGIAERFFSRDECEFLSKLTAANRVEFFFRYWTLKEAYLKARGLGLALPLKEFTMLFAGEDRARIGIEFSGAIKDDAAMWRFHFEKPEPDRALAVAVRGAAARGTEFRVGRAAFLA